jgi:hypothetical protein
MRRSHAAIVFLTSCLPVSGYQPPTLVGANPAQAGASSPPDRGQCVVDGTYRMQALQASNNPWGCSHGHVETGTEGDTITVTVVDGTASVGISSMSGTCEGGKLNGCVLTSKCDFFASNGGGSLQLQWTFQQSGFTGTFDAQLRNHSISCRLLETVKAWRSDAPHATVAD